MNLDLPGRGSKTIEVMQTFRTMSVIHCGGCKQDMDESEGFYIEPLSLWYHPQCFRCYGCYNEFSQENPFSVLNQKALCDSCYEKETASQEPVCYSCQEPISGPISYAFGQPYHQRHLQCDRCHLPIKGKIYEHQNRVYCEDDFRPLVSRTCQGCHLPFDQRGGIHAMGISWHRECLKCVACGQTFPDKKFFVLDGQPLCAKDYHDSTQTLCGRCFKPVVGKAYDVPKLGRVFHPDCWVCNACEHPLDDTFFEYKSGYFCSEHHARTYLPPHRN
ncbi:hypothetical protein EDD86DRAFT_9925 [Gorgonomyces haynaldii]|nr:hypothetical protein EDD86DRAFT_9925 [Gorgonomyces haynaldii]